MLEKDPLMRISALEALDHEFITRNINKPKLSAYDIKSWDNFLDDKIDIDDTSIVQKTMHNI